MNELINKAVSIIDSFDWYWRMEDTNYKANQAKAKYLKNQFRSILCHITDSEIKEALRQLWIANYNLSRPYRDNEYYINAKAELKAAEDKLKQLTNQLITI